MGYETQETTLSNTTTGISIALKPGNELLNQVVVSASRVEEKILKSPVTVEKLDALAVRNTPTLSYYDGLISLKSLDMVTSSLTYKQVNTRGFNDTGNTLPTAYTGRHHSIFFI